MSDTQALIERLRAFVALDGGDLDDVERAADTIARLEAERDALKTVMVAAAEEISAHWQAHCDAEGYGPQNLMRRLEEGIPSEYGYTAGAFAQLKAERDAARETARRMMEAERATADAARREAMEECLRICDAEASVEGIAQRCAAAIRAAMEKP